MSRDLRQDIIATFEKYSESEYCSQLRDVRHSLQNHQLTHWLKSIFCLHSNCGFVSAIAAVCLARWNIIYHTFRLRAGLLSRQKTRQEET
ncbi:MAG TPA: hypothetical protein VGC86_03110 [Afipia sp.]